MTSDHTTGLWITSDPQPDGTYTLVLSINGDVSRAMTPDEALDYGRTVFGVAATTDYEAGVFAQLIDHGVDEGAVLQFVAELRGKRPTVDDAATRPLRYVPGLNQEGEGFIRLELNGTQIGQLSPADARGHAAHVIEAVPHAALDAVYRSLLVSRVGLDDRAALGVVDRLGAFVNGNGEA